MVIDYTEYVLWNMSKASLKCSRIIKVQEWVFTLTQLIIFYYNSFKRFLLKRHKKSSAKDLKKWSTLFNPFPLTANLQQMTLKMSTKNMENLYNCLENSGMWSSGVRKPEGRIGAIPPFATKSSAAEASSCGKELEIEIWSCFSLYVYKTGEQLTFKVWHKHSWMYCGQSNIFKWPF